jgi:hypothetical protein
MSVCNLTVLEASACTNGFWGAAQSEVLADAVELQLLYTASGGTQTLKQLEASACANGFYGASQTPDQFTAAMLQLLCTASGG